MATEHASSEFIRQAAAYCVTAPDDGVEQSICLFASRHGALACRLGEPSHLTRTLSDGDHDV